MDPELIENQLKRSLSHLSLGQARVDAHKDGTPPPPTPTPPTPAAPCYYLHACTTTLQDRLGRGHMRAFRRLPSQASAIRTTFLPPPPSSSEVRGRTDSTSSSLMASCKFQPPDFTRISRGGRFFCCVLSTVKPRPRSSYEWMITLTITDRPIR